LGVGRRSSGVSAVVGTAIAVMIFFTVMIPMWLYLQQLQTIYMDEVSRRLQFEVEKLNEKLDIILTIQPPDYLSRRFLHVTLMNKGPIEVTVPVLYIESSDRGLYPVPDSEFKIPPGAVIMRQINYEVLPGERVMARAPTLRGNSFVSGEPIGPNRLPYLLIVQLSNVSIGYRYRALVSVVSDEINKLRGCVSLKSEEFSNGCRGRAESERFITSVEEVSEVFAFNIAPGVYEVKVAQCRFDGAGCANIAPSPVRVEANSHVVVQIDSRSSIRVPRPLPLMVSPLLNYTTIILPSQATSSTVYIPYIVTLGNVTEPLADVLVSIGVLSYDNLTAVTLVGGSSHQITLLSPGSSYVGFFIVEIVDEGDTQKYGGYFIYELKVESARGAVTRQPYSGGDFELHRAVGVIYVCRWWQEGPGGNGGGTVEIRTACRAP